MLRLRSIKALAYQVEPAPTPTTEMGEQSMPIGISTPSKTTPRRPRSTLTAFVLDDSTLLQQLIAPVLHSLTEVTVAVAVTVTVVVASVVVGVPHGVATARRGRARREAVANFIATWRERRAERSLRCQENWLFSTAVEEALSIHFIPRSNLYVCSLLVVHVGQGPYFTEMTRGN